MRANLSVSQYN